MRMTRHVFRITAALLSFALGLAAASVTARFATPRDVTDAVAKDTGARASDDGPVALPRSSESEPARVGQRGVWSDAHVGDEVFEPDSASPFDIERAVNEVNAKSGGARVELDSTWEKLGLPTDAFSACAASACEAEVARHELDGEPGREAVLRLNMPHNVGRYLVFKRAPGGAWRLLGFVEHDFNRYADSYYRVERAGGRNWLVIYGQEGSGQGFALYGETWYEAAPDGLREVLHYPVQGSLYPGPETLGHELSSKLVSTQSDGAGRASVTIKYGVTYQTFGGDLNSSPFDIFTNVQRVRYVWDERERNFAFDAAGSEVTPEEINVVSEGDGISELDAWDVFLKYNCARVLKLAASGGQTRRVQWLRGIADRCGDTPRDR